MLYMEDGCWRLLFRFSSALSVVKAKIRALITAEAELDGHAPKNRVSVDEIALNL